MPAPIGPLVGFALGVALAAIGGSPVERDAQMRGLLLVGLFSLLVFAPAAAYFVAFAPDWSYGYAVDSRRIPEAVDFGILFADVASVPAGFRVAQRESGRPAVVAWLGAVPAAAVIALVVLGARRLEIDATYAQYHGDFGARNVAGSPLGWALLGAWTLIAAAAVVTARTLRALRRAQHRD